MWARRRAGAERPSPARFARSPGSAHRRAKCCRTRCQVAPAAYTDRGVLHQHCGGRRTRLMRVGHSPVASPPDRGRTRHLPGPRAGARRRADHRGGRCRRSCPPGGWWRRGAARVIACGAALNGEDEALWPALPVGLLGAGLAATVSRDVAAGAARRRARLTRGRRRAGADRGDRDRHRLRGRGGRGQPAGPALLPGGLLALAWLALSRRRREERKHEGLRVLR